MNVVVKKKVKFSEVRRSKRPLQRGGKQPKAGWRKPFGVETRRLRIIRCTIM
jgi:hypothetical protein